MDVFCNGSHSTSRKVSSSKKSNTAINRLVCWKLFVLHSGTDETKCPPNVTAAIRKTRKCLMCEPKRDFQTCQCTSPFYPKTTVRCNLDKAVKGKMELLLMSCHPFCGRCPGAASSIKSSAVWCASSMGKKGFSLILACVSLEMISCVTIIGKYNNN